MGFEKLQNSKDEILNGKPHFIYIFPSILIVLTAIVVGFILLFLLGSNLPLKITFLSIVVISSIAGILLCVYFLSLQYIVTGDRITFKSGIFNVNTIYIEMYRIKDIEMREPFFYRFFKLCNVKIYSSDHDTPEFIFHAQKKGLQNELRTAVETARKVKGVREIDAI